MTALVTAPTDAVPWTGTVHTGPGTLAGRYMRSFWQPVFVVKALPVRKARPTRILGEDFTVYRGESGQPHVVGVRCAHRGTQLSVGWVEGETLRCRYHGCVYDAEGHCVEQPGEPEPFCQKIRIPAYSIGVIRDIEDDEIITFDRTLEEMARLSDGKGKAVDPMSRT